GVEVEMVASSPPQIHPLSTIARPSLGPRSVDGSAESCGSVKVHYRRIESKGSTVPLTMLGLEGIRGSKSAKHPPPRLWSTGVDINRYGGLPPRSGADKAGRI